MVAHYQGECWSQIYIACVGTNTQALIDTLKSMFGEPDLNIEELDTETQQEIQKEALATEVKSIEKGTGVSHPSSDETCITVSQSPVPSEFSITEGG